MKNPILVSIGLAAALGGAQAFAQNMPAPTPNAAMAPGLYVQVIDGLIHVNAGGGTQNFAAGQFGYTPGATQPPVVLPKNPGIAFTPPPVFNAPTGPVASTGGKSAGVDCEVR